MNTAEIQRASQFDVSKAIAHGGLTNLQRWTYVLASLAIIIAAATTLTAEYILLRLTTMAVTTAIVCYPAEIRTTDAETAMAIGRVGAFVSAFAGAAMITAGGSDAYLN